MKKLRLNLASLFLVGFFFISASNLFAQLVPNYCVFGQNSLYLGPITKIDGMLVGSNGNINFGGSVHVDGVEGGGNFVGGTNVVVDHITVNGYVNMAGGTRVINDVNAGDFIKTGTNITIGFGGAGNAFAGSDVTLIGGNRVFGNIDAGGNVVLNNNTAHVYGNIIAAGTFTKTPYAKVDGTITAPGVPTPPLSYTPITLPAATTFSSGGLAVTNPGPGGTTLSPGSYGALNITGAKTSLTLIAGDYYFDSFNFQSTYPALTFDVTAGKIRIFVTGDFKIRQSATISVVGGGAEDVYVETHGDFTTGGATVWNGTVFAPYGEIHIAKTNKVTGSFYGLVITTENDITITCKPFIPPPPPDECPPYCIFGKDGVNFGPITKTNGGWVGSNSDITFAGSVQTGGVEGSGNFVGGPNVVADHITVNGYVNMGGGTRVIYDVNAGSYIVTGTNITIGYGSGSPSFGTGNAVAGGDVTLVGGNRVFGNVESGGNVWLNSNTAHVYGNIIAAGTFTNGTSPVDGTITAPGVPSPPLAYIPITFPPATTFTSGGSNITTNPGAGGTTLAPGSYGAFNISGAQTSFTFTAGTYYFDSFNYQSTYPALTFDVTAGKIKVYVTGDITFRQSATITVVGGSAADVYVETHGDFTTGGATTWNGIVFAPEGEIYIAKTNKAIGLFWGKKVTTENDVTFTCIGVCPYDVLPKLSKSQSLIQTKETITPAKYSLVQNYPNPFNPSTVIKYNVPQTAHVKITIFDMLGREIATLVNEEKSAGTYKVTFNASNLSSGVYFYRIQADNFIQIKKMMLLK